VGKITKTALVGKPTAKNRLEDLRLDGGITIDGSQKTRPKTCALYSSEKGKVHSRTGHEVPEGQ
jgi:hypothetical protein